MIYDYNSQFRGLVDIFIKSVLKGDNSHLRIEKIECVFNTLPVDYKVILMLVFMSNFKS